MSITVKGVSKFFGKFAALNKVDLEVPDGNLVALLGPSGSGKTTLLRIISGLELADEGTVLIQNEDVTRRSARERNIGFVFQHYALFRHMTVFENIGFSLRVRHRKSAEVRERVMELLKLIRLEGIENRYPSQLSGGQRQRVALARALAAQPGLLLLDEPFGALDAKVRGELRQWLRRLHDELHVTSLFVTHDQEEAFAVADKVVVMHQGRIEQVGTPHEVFDHPANAFVMDFLGNVNVFQGRLEKGRAMLGNVVLSHGHKPPGDSEPTSLTTRENLAQGKSLGEAALGDDRPATLYVRPHELEIEMAPNGQPTIRAVVQHLNPAGPVTRVQLKAVDFDLTLHVDLTHQRRAELQLAPGDTVYVVPRQVRVFPSALDYSI